MEDIFSPPLGCGTPGTPTASLLCLWLHFSRRASQASERVLFIGTQFSNLYTAVDTPANGRVGVCVVFVFACKYVLGHSRVSQPPNSGYASSGTLAFSPRRMPPRPVTDDALTHTGSSAALRPAPSHPMGPSLSPSRLAQTSTMYTHDDNLMIDS